GDAVEEVDRAVDRVDDPGDAGAALPRSAALLAEEPVLGPGRPQPCTDQLLDGPVGLGHDVGGRALRRGHPDALSPHPCRQRGGLERDVAGEVPEYAGIRRNGLRHARTASVTPAQRRSRAALVGTALRRADIPRGREVADRGAYG